MTPLQHSPKETTCVWLPGTAHTPPAPGFLHWETCMYGLSWRHLSHQGFSLSLLSSRAPSLKLPFRKFQSLSVFNCFRLIVSDFCKESHVEVQEVPGKHWHQFSKQHYCKILSYTKSKINLLTSVEWWLQSLSGISQHCFISLWHR